MRIGILKTGHPPTDIGLTVPTYPEMVRTALGHTYTYREFDIASGDLPVANAHIDAYVITGSAAGVYDPDPWIPPFRIWLQALDPAIPLVGICFGHQIMAEAYGGAVEKSEAGWTGGLRQYTVMSREPWMDNVNTFVLPIAHQDRVVTQPPASRLIASSVHCPYAALTYTQRRALSFQAHPEFELDYTALLIDRYRRSGAISSEAATRARNSLQQPDDRAVVASWIRRFLHAARD